MRLDPDQTWAAYESELSGGMKQRVAIALDLALKPSVIVLDEPTTALDVLNQRLVIDALSDLHRSLGVTIVFVTHDWPVSLVEVDNVTHRYRASVRRPVLDRVSLSIRLAIARAISVGPQLLVADEGPLFQPGRPGTGHVLRSRGRGRAHRSCDRPASTGTPKGPVWPPPRRTAKRSPARLPSQV